jgi:hypothetical protein
MRLLFTFALFLIGNLLQAQVEIVAEQDQDRNLTLLAFNKSKIPFTIQIEFIKLENLASPDGRLIYGVATPGKSNLVKLYSEYVNVQTGFQYNTKLYKGDYLQSSQDRPAYLIPVEEGTTLSMRPLSVEIPQNTSVQGSLPYTGVGFYFEKPTVICAPRKGIVSEIKMDIEKASSGPSDFNSENYLEIYHQDGTFSRLSGLKAASAKVAIGDVVFPGQAIAESSSLPDQTKHHVKMIQSRWEMGDRGMVWMNFPVTIFADQNEVQSDKALEALKSSHPTDLISKEMDKKELKKYLGK